MNYDPGMHIVRTQHAVGQGGFHSAEVRYGQSSFSYVYDCGSSNPRPLAREIEAFAESRPAGPLELVALSHLDADHVNGLGHLLDRVGAATVILPYFHPAELKLLGLYWQTCGPVPPGLEGIWDDPGDWLRDRGVDNVIFVLPSEAGAEPVVPASSTLPDPPLEPFQLIAGRRATAEESKRYSGLGPDDRVIVSGEALSISAGGGGRLNEYWRLVPFTHPYRDRTSQTSQLQDRLSSLQRRPGGLLGALLARGSNEEIKVLYRAIRYDRNLTSMLLYSGPSFAGTLPLVRQSTRYSWLPRGLGGERTTTQRTSRVGWLGTGDAHLTIRGRVELMRSHFVNCLGDIGTFMFPHHGSKKNFNPRLFEDSAIRPHVWVAAAGPNQWEHPDVRLRRWAGQRGQFVRVDGVARRELREEITVAI